MEADKTQAPQGSPGQHQRPRGGEWLWSCRLSADIIIRNRKYCPSKQTNSQARQGRSSLLLPIALKVFLKSQVGFHTRILPLTVFNVLGVSSRELAFMEGCLFERGNSASCDTDEAKLISIRVRLQPGDPGVSPKMRFCPVLLGWGGPIARQPPAVCGGDLQTCVLSGTVHNRRARLKCLLASQRRNSV